ncbi:MAG: prephenate dehydrogenase/arogenate dehydrogenase family protein [Clostridia bacterium]|nr:prephenate dehydrogenase/arogenate dehydrogenase family protein [Clostridia bacterium]
MNIAIIGLGLIGGSLARTIKLHTEHTVYGCDLNPLTIQQAFLMGAIDQELTEDSLRACDMVLVSLYPGAIIDWVTAHADDFKPGCLVIDCGGVKQEICAALTPLAKGKNWHFLGGHPMAGREFSGFRYARDDLFDNASMILCTDGTDDPFLLQRARDFFLDLGFRRVQFTDPRTHDEMIAYTSQLAHIVSSAYVKCPLADKHRGFSAGSFADMTRVARLNEDMWTELFLANREALLPVVDDLVRRMTEYRDALRDGDSETMMTLLREGREIKERLQDN